MSQPMQQQPSRADPLFGPIGKSAQSGSTGSSTGGYSGGGYSGNANSRSTTGGSTGGGLSGSSGNANAQVQQTQGGYGTPPSYAPSYVVVIHDPQTGDRVFGPFATTVDAYAASARYHQRYLYGSHMTTTLILVEDPTSIP